MESRYRGTDASMKDSPSSAGDVSCITVMKALRKLVLQNMNGNDRQNPVLAIKYGQARSRNTSNDAKKGSPDPRSPSVGLVLPVAPCAHFDCNEGIPQSPCAQPMSDRSERAFYWPVQAT